MRHKNFILNIFIGLISALLALLMVEVLLRLNGQGPWGNLDTGRSDPTINKPHLKLGWIPQKGVYYFKKYTREGNDFTISILDDGSRKIDNKKNSKQKELIFFGGSITLGWGVNDDQTFTSKLQVKFKDYKIRNFSAGGYGTLQIYLRLKEIIEKNNNISAIVISYLPHHSIRNIGDEFWLRTLTKYSKRGYVSLPYASLTDNNQLILNKPIKYYRTPLMDYSSISNKISKKIMQNKLRDNHLNAEKVTKVIFSEIQDLLKKKNIKLIILNLSQNSEALRPYMQTFSDKKISFIDCTFKHTDDLVIKGDGHPNAKLHQLYSECLYRNLVNLLNYEN